MLTIIKPNELTLQNITAMETSGEHKIKIIHNVEDTAMFQVALERILIVLMHSRMPEAVKQGKKTASVNLGNLQGFGLSPWLCTYYSDLLQRSLFSHVSRILTPHGYKVSLGRDYVTGITGIHASWE